MSFQAPIDRIRYAQCWEDAEVLLPALAIQPGAVCVSIASAGDNSLSLLTRDPARVIAIDLNPAQIACLELRVAAWRKLDHGELLQLIGVRAAAPGERQRLYEACRKGLSRESREFWEANRQAIDAGIGSAGKFERYFSLFRRRVLPWVHSRRKVTALLEPRPPEERWRFYDERWDTWRWRAMFRLFFSRFVMGRLGRDPSFFAHVDGPVAPRILDRTRHALAELDPSENPYLHWILEGRYREPVLPHALREEHFECIRGRLDRLEWRLSSVESLVETPEAELGPVDAWNLSDIFEYLPMAEYHQLLEKIAARSRPGARLAYWNMLAPRSRPPEMADRLRSLDDLGRELLARDRAFFYSRFVVEEVVGGEE